LCPHLLGCIATQQMLFQKEDGLLCEEVGVVFLSEPVSLVIEASVPAWRPLTLQSGDELKRFALRHSGVIGALGDEERLVELVDMVDGRDGLQNPTHFGVSLITVLLRHG